MKRYRGIVGKSIGGKVYAHKMYADLVVPAHRTAADALRGKFPLFGYNVVVWGITEPK